MNGICGTPYSVKKCDLVDYIKIDSWYVAYVVHGCCPPNWIFKGIVFGPFHTFGEPIVYIPTKFCENILIRGRDMPQKRNSKWTFWRRNSSSAFNFDKCHLSGTFLCMIRQNFTKITQLTAELYVVQLFLYLPLNLHCQRYNGTVPWCRPSIYGYGLPLWTTPLCFTRLMSVCHLEQSMWNMCMP